MTTRSPWALSLLGLGLLAAAPAPVQAATTHVAKTPVKAPAKPAKAPPRILAVPASVGKPVKTPPPIPVPPVPRDVPPPPPIPVPPVPLDGPGLVDVANRAQIGDVRQQYRLGLIYLTGKGAVFNKSDIGVNYTAAAAWLKKAADMDDAQAEYDLSTMYKSGYGWPRDYAKAAALLQRAADSGYGPAQRDLGDLYHQGLGVPQDDVEAWKWLDVGIRTLAGEQIATASATFKERDDIAAALTADQLAQAKSEAGAWTQAPPTPNQQVTTAQNDIDLGRLKESLDLLTPLGESGNPDAQFMLGLTYLFGYGVTKDPVAAAGWFRKASDQGHAGAQAMLGTMYYRGAGVAEDDAMAMDLFQKAADKGILLCQVNLAAMYHTGKGVAKDDAAALKWLQRAAKQGNGDAQYALAQIYFAGDGVNADAVAGYKWLLLSDTYATSPEIRTKADAGIVTITARMTSADVRDAKTDAEMWQPTFEVP